MATTQTSTALQPMNLFAPKPNTTTSSATPPKPIVERTRPYKDFLTPALHRRFTRAAGLILAACYIASILLSPPSILWIWNPLSMTGIRSFLLFTSCLAVFIVRVANIHIGELTTTSPAQTVTKYLGVQGLSTLFWYCFSACFYGEVYIWSQSAGAGLGWVDQGKSYERPRLNENPIFLRSVWFCLAVAQAGLHLARGEDRVPMSERSQAGDRQATVGEQPKTKLPPSLQELSERAPTMAGRILRLVVPGCVFALPVYFLLLRRFLWPYFYTVGRTFFRQLPVYSRPTGLSNPGQLVWQTVYSSVILIALWELSNAVFTIFVSRPPLKREQPLTSEVKDAQGNVVSRSKDPNGSLIAGLKSKKETPKAFAFWELWLVCSQYEPRRKTIYTEIDRAGGSTWSQISTQCLNELEAIRTRIREAQAPAEHKKATSEAERQKQQQENLIASQPAEQLGMPRIADRKVLDGQIWTKQRPADFAHSVGNMAKAIGQSPGANNPVAPPARKVIEWSADKVLSREEQQRLSREGLTREANSTLVKLLKLPPGEAFRQTFARRVCAVVLGTPYSCRQNIIHASQSLSTLCTRSLQEDNYGQVAKSVAVIIRTYTATISDIDKFVVSLPPSWTDVFFTEQDRIVLEVEEVKAVLKLGLERVLLAFGEYADAVQITKELREAREVVGRGTQVRVM